MAIVLVSEILKKEIYKKFKKESVKILELFTTLEDNPKKGKLLGVVNGVAIKELKYKSFRFYFIVDDFEIRFFENSELDYVIIRFIRMSSKKDQKKVINEIKEVLKELGRDSFTDLD